MLEYFPCYNESTYGLTTTVQTTSLALNSVKSMMYLWVTATNTKRIEIWRITGTASNGAPATSTILWRGCHITAENVTPGGSAVVPRPIDPSSAASVLTSTTGVARYGAAAPTRVANDVFCEVQASNNSSQQYLLFDASKTGKPIVLRAGTAEGFEVRIVTGNVAQTTAARGHVSFLWTES